MGCTHATTTLFGNNDEESNGGAGGEICHMLALPSVSVVQEGRIACFQLKRVYLK
jgi:hypothetical protein